MPGLLYIHGFLSSPKSQKARQMGEWLEFNRPECRYHCPFLTPYPHDTRQTLETIINKHLTDDDGIYLMGSSLGGFWATWLAEKYNLKSVLINPVVELSMFQGDFIDKELRNYHTDDSYVLSKQDIDGFADYVLEEITRPENYLVMLQTGDEVLDYRLAVERYTESRQLVEDGGDHGYRGFPEKIELIMDFLEGGGPGK